MVRDVEIRGSMIRLGQLLKLVGAIDSGAEVKHSWLPRRCVSTEKRRTAEAGSFAPVTSFRSGSASCVLFFSVSNT